MRRSTTASLVVVAGLAIGGGLVLLGQHDRADGTSIRTPGSVASVNWGSSPDAGPAPGRPGPRRSSRTRVPAAGPVIDPGPGTARLAIARLGVSAPVTPVTVTGREMGVPIDPHTVGWWSGGARPGAGQGTVVVDGHINYAGVTGALAVLPRLHAGDIVTISQGKVVLRYVVRAVHTYPKATGIPVDVFRTTGPPQLNLITCGGPYDADSRNYEDNVVALAVPA
jgi:hypothetical protein